MARTTIYCVQPFWQDGRKLAQGALRQFKKEELALQAGATAANRNAGVIVYSVVGDPEYEDWSEPKLIAKHGLVPDLQF